MVVSHFMNNKMKKIKFKRSFKLFGKFRAMTIGRYVIVFDHSVLNNKIVMNHEAIHYQQIKDLGFIRFYVLYCAYFISAVFRYRNWMKAYQNIPFEREAYRNENNKNYLLKRYTNAWKDYIY